MTTLPQGDELDRVLEKLVERSLRGEKSLEELVGWLVLGRKPRPARDACWTAEQRIVWMRAVQIWVATRDKTRGPVIRRRAPARQQAVGRVWDAIFKGASEFRAPWQQGKHLSWRALADRLGVSQRAAIYMIEVQQGWKFQGQGGGRVCLVAVCEDCGDGVELQHIIDRRCRRCRKLDPKSVADVASGTFQPPTKD